MKQAWLILTGHVSCTGVELANIGEDKDWGLFLRATGLLSPNTGLHIMFHGHVERELFQWLHGFLVHGGQWCI